MGADIANAHAHAVHRLGLHDNAPLVGVPIRLDAIRYAEEAKVVTPFEAVIGGTRPVKRISRCDDAALVGEAVAQGGC